MRGPQYRAIEADRVWLAGKYNHRILLLGVLGGGRRGRAADAFCKPEAVLARAPHVRVIDTCNARIDRPRID